MSGKIEVGDTLGKIGKILFGNNEKNDSYQEILNRRIKELEDERRKKDLEYKKKLSDIDKEIQRLEKENKERIEELITKSKKEKEDLIKAFEKEANKLNEKIANIQDMIVEKNKNEEENVEYWKKYVGFILEDLKDRLNIERFKKEDLNEIEEINCIINDNINKKNLQAAISLLQNLYLKSNKLRYSLEVINIEASEIEARILAYYEKIEKDIKNGKIVAKFKNDQNEDVEVEIDYKFWGEKKWKEFEFYKLKDYVDNLKKYNFEELKKIYDFYVNANEQLEDIKKYAFEKYVLSIKIQERNEEWVEKMETIGFFPVKNIFKYGDERKNNFLLFENSEGEKILIDSYIDDDNKVNTIMKFSSLKDKALHNERMKKICKLLDIKSYKDLPGYEEKAAEAEDFELEKFEKKIQK